MSSISGSYNYPCAGGTYNREGVGSAGSAGSALGAGSAGSTGSSGSAGSFGSTVTGSATGSFGDWFDPPTAFIGYGTDCLRNQTEDLPRNTVYGINLEYGNGLGTPPLDPGNDFLEDSDNYSEWFNENKRK